MILSINHLKILSSTIEFGGILLTCSFLKLISSFSAGIRWEQWHLRVVVNNTPRPVSDDSAAVIERQRIQVCMCKDVLNFARLLLDLRHAHHLSTLTFSPLFFSGYGRRNASIGPDEDI